MRLIFTFLLFTSCSCFAYVKDKTTAHANLTFELQELRTEIKARELAHLSISPVLKMRVTEIMQLLAAKDTRRQRVQPTVISNNQKD